MKKLILILTFLTPTFSQDVFRNTINGKDYTILQSVENGVTQYTILDPGAKVKLIPANYPTLLNSNPNPNAQFNLQQLLYLQQLNQQLQTTNQQLNNQQVKTNQKLDKISQMLTPKQRRERKHRSFRQRMTTKGKINNSLLITGAANEILNKDDKFTDHKKARIGIGAAYLLNNIIR